MSTTNAGTLVGAVIGAFVRIAGSICLAVLDPSGPHWLRGVFWLCLALWALDGVTSLLAVVVHVIRARSDRAEAQLHRIPGEIRRSGRAMRDARRPGPFVQ